MQPKATMQPKAAMQPKAQILDIYGTFVRDFGGWISVKALVELMGDLDTEPQAVRSATSRMKRRGMLEPDRRGRRAGYRLTEASEQILRDGDSRIFRTDGDTVGPAWVVAFFSVPEAQRNKRHAIRSQLGRLGFAQDPTGAWFAPAAVAPETRRTLGRHDLSSYVSLWRGDYFGFAEMSELVAGAWDLAAIRGHYDGFIALARGIAANVTDPDPRQAFVDYLKMVSAWRPLPYLDPGLPDDVTPDGWPRNEAREIFGQLNAELRPDALRHFVSIALADD